MNLYTRKDNMKSKFKYDGKSRPVNDIYTKRWVEIFRKKDETELKESYEQSLKNKKDRNDKKK